MIKKIISNLIPETFKKKLKIKLGVPDQEMSFLRLKSLGFNPQYVLDIGAFQGEWAKSFKLIFPSSEIMMIEGQQSKEQLLNEICQTNSGLSYKIALLGSREEEVDFNIYETASSVLKETNETGAKVEKRRLMLLDNIVANSPFSKADFIKLDTQGYELEILKGGVNVLQHAKAVLMEVSFIDIYTGSPLVHDVLEFMKSQGFVLYDICSLMRRPFDQALFQSDFLFVKENSVLRSSKRWS